MPDQVKTIIVERNGVELDFQEEYSFIPENLPFSETGYTSDNVKDAIVEAGNKGGGGAIDYQSFFQSTQFNTSSNGWVNVFDEDATTITDGTYLIILTVEQSHTDKQRECGLRLRQENTTILDVRDGVGIDDVWKSVTFTRVGRLVTNERFRVDHGKTSNGTTRIRNISLTLIKLG